LTFDRILADGDADLRVISLNYLAKIGGRRAFEAVRGTIQSDYLRRPAGG